MQGQKTLHIGLRIFYFIRKAEIQTNKRSSVWCYSVELALTTELFLNNDKCTVEISLNTESKIIAEKYPAFRLLVEESMNYTAYANLESVAG